MKYKYRFGYGLMFMEKQEMRMLEKMAAKGWEMESLSRWGRYRFHKSEPQQVRYAIDMTELLNTGPGFAEYREIFEVGGWQYVTSLGGFHFFRAAPGTTPIYTQKQDEAEKHQRMTRLAWSTLIFLSILLAGLAGLCALFKSLPVYIVAAACAGLVLSYSFGLVLNLWRARRR